MEIEENLGVICGDSSLLSVPSNDIATEPYLQQASQITDPNKLESLISQITATPNIYVFSEFLDIETIKSLEKTSSYYKLLELFAFGTIKDYYDQKVTKNLPELNPPQIKKLKYLTVISLAYSHKNIPYKIIQDELNISSIRELEDLLIEIIYTGLIVGKIDQKSQQLCIEYAISRDIKQNEIPILIHNLQKWYENNETLLHSIESEMQNANSKKKEAILNLELINRKIQSQTKLVKANIARSVKQHNQSTSSKSSHHSQGLTTPRKNQHDFMINNPLAKVNSTGITSINNSHYNDDNGNLLFNYELNNSNNVNQNLTASNSLPFGSNHSPRSTAGSVNSFTEDNMIVDQIPEDFIEDLYDTTNDNEASNSMPSTSTDYISNLISFNPIKDSLNPSKTNRPTLTSSNNNSNSTITSSNGSSNIVNENGNLGPLSTTIQNSAVNAPSNSNKKQNKSKTTG
ncbi:unnamed protein product [Gordionus sp. m RMFG-2023]